MRLREAFPKLIALRDEKQHFRFSRKPKARTECLDCQEFGGFLSILPRLDIAVAVGLRAALA